jgi:hypothetical protein
MKDYPYKHNGHLPETFFSLNDVLQYIENSFKDNNENLCINDSLNDPAGFNMAIITDKAIEAGYMPCGFDLKEGYRIYKFTKEI